MMLTHIFAVASVLLQNTCMCGSLSPVQFFLTCIGQLFLTCIGQFFLTCVFLSYLHSYFLPSYFFLTCGVLSCCFFSYRCKNTCVVLSHLCSFFLPVYLFPTCVILGSAWSRCLVQFSVVVQPQSIDGQLDLTGLSRSLQSDAQTQAPVPTYDFVVSRRSTAPQPPSTVNIQRNCFCNRLRRPIQTEA